MTDKTDTQISDGGADAGPTLVAGGRLSLDPVRAQVMLDGKLIELGGRSFTLLYTLMRHPMEPLSKDRLIELVWEGRAVSDAVLTTAVRDLRRALDDDAKRPSWIKTEHGRGYRFIAEVRIADDTPAPSLRQAEATADTPFAIASDAAPPAPDREVQPLPFFRLVAGVVGIGLMVLLGAFVLTGRSPSTEPSINRSVAVLGFENLSTDSDTVWFADGLSEELTSTLTRVPDLRVASRRAVITAAGTATDLQDIASSLGVAHVLEGAIRVLDDQVRVTVSLVKTEDGSQIWSQSYDRDFTNILDLQAEIATAVANTLDTALDPDALERMASAGTDSIAAYEAYMRGQALMMQFWRTGDSASWAQSLPLLDRARSIDPNFAQAHAASALAFKYENTPSLVMREDALTGEAYRLEYASRLDAAIAAARDPSEAASYRAVRSLELFELSEARDAFATYLADHPNDVEAGFEYGNTLVMMGRQDEARQLVRRLATIIPRQDATSRSILIQSARRARDFEFAAQIARETLSDHPYFGFALVEAHWALLQVGDVDQARDVAARIEASQIGRIAQSSIRLHQLCADGDRAEADSIAAEMVAHPRSFIVAWFAYRALGEDDAAYARMAQLDEPGPPPAALRTLLVADPAFDASRFPHLSRAILNAGGQLVEPADALVRCPQPD